MTDPFPGYHGQVVLSMGRAFTRFSGEGFLIITTRVFPKVVVRNTPLGLDGSMQQMLHILKANRLEEQKGGVIAFNGSPDRLIALIIQGCIEVAQHDRQRGLEN